jgi:hypothetical protein
VSISPRIVLGFSLVAAVLAVLASCRQDEPLAFTKAPARSAFKIEPKPVMTGVFFALPVEPQEALAAAEAALPEKIARINEPVQNAACGKRVKDIECVSGRVEGEIVRNGPIELTAKDGKLVLKVPLKYALSMRGHGWAAGIEDKKAGTLTASSQVEAVLHSGFALDLAAPEPSQWSERHLTFGKGQLDLGRAAAPKMQAMQAAFSQRLTAELAAQPVPAAVQKIWRTLQQPLLLAKAPELWLSADPVRVSGAGFQQDARRLTYRIAIGARASLHETKPTIPGQRPTTVKRAPDPTRSTPDMMTTQLRLPILIGNERLQTIATRTFPAKEQLTTQADRFSDAVQVATRRAHVYASQRLLALELDLDVVGPKPWTGRNGRLHLLGRPVLEDSLETVGIDSVSMPLTTSRDIREAKDAASTSKLRVGAEPFAARLASGFKIDIAQDVQNAVAQINANLEQKVEDNTTLSVKFNSGQATAVEPISEGLAVIVTVTGQLTLQPDLPQLAGTAGSGEQIPSQHVAGSKGTPQPRKK